MWIWPNHWLLWKRSNIKVVTRHSCSTGTRVFDTVILPLTFFWGASGRSLDSFAQRRNCCAACGLNCTLSEATKALCEVWDRTAACSWRLALAQSSVVVGTDSSTALVRVGLLMMIIYRRSRDFPTTVCQEIGIYFVHATSRIIMLTTFSGLGAVLQGWKSDSPIEILLSLLRQVHYVKF